jgi:hypothetical protein
METAPTSEKSRDVGVDAVLQAGTRAPDDYSGDRSSRLDNEIAVSATAR